MTSPADPVAIARDLLRCPSVTPVEGGALSFLETMLKGAGFTVHRMTFSEPGTADVENLYARIGTGAPHLMFAGHTDVVPPGDPKAWSHAPFSGDIADGVLYGRGAVDMKGAIACKVAAALDHLAANGGKPKGSISFLITGDEEGIAVNGSPKLLKWAAARGETFDHCVLGEPGNVDDARRHHQARPPRLAERRARRHRQDGPRRLSAPRRQSGARPRQADERADGRAARPGQPQVRSVEPGVHLDRHRQPDGESHSRRGAGALQHPLQRLPRLCVAEGAGRAARGEGRRRQGEVDDRLGAVERRRVLHRAEPVHRRGDRRGRRGDRQDAEAVDLRRHVGRALHQGLLPGGGVRPGRPDHARHRRARAGRRICRR